jgi:hypothetical protein
LCAPEYGTKGARLGKYSGAKLTSPALQIAALSKWQSWTAEGGASGSQRLSDLFDNKSVLDGSPTLAEQIELLP